jgi:integrase/recombinase XerD
MLASLVESYVAIRRACGFAITCEASLLQSFAEYSYARGQHLVRAETAVEWAGLARSVHQRARRLGSIIRFSRYIRAENPLHELPPTTFGSERTPRPVPYIFTTDEIQRLVQAARVPCDRTLRSETYSTLFALLACTGLRVSEAIHLRYDDVTPDGLLIRHSKCRKSRLVPLHETAQAGLERYLQRRRPYAPFDDHVFISSRRTPLRLKAVEVAFDAAAIKIGLPREPRRRRPTPHSLRHSFVVRSLETCSDNRDRITAHTVALSTYLGHTRAEDTYYYLEATGHLMRGIAEQCEHFVSGGQPS